jgi:colicin import membrane protein
MKDGEATVSAGKTAFFPTRAGALMGLLVVTGLLSLPLQAAFDPPDTPSAAALPVIDRNFAGVVAVGDDDVLKVAEARLIRVAEGAPKEPNPPARAGEGLGAAPEPWPARDLSLMERVQDWLARANREFQTVIVRRLSIAPPGGGGDDIAKKLEQVKDEEAEAVQAKQAAEVQRRKEAANAAKVAEETRKERERLAMESKRAAEAQLAAQAQQEAAKKAALREAARKAEAESQARVAEERARAERVAEDQKRRREEEHQRALADAASKAAEDAKRAEETAERQAKQAAVEAQRRAEQEAAKAAAVKEAEEKARAAAAREAERERLAREDAAKAAQADAVRAKLAEERAKQEAAAKDAADRQRAAEDAARAAALKAADEKAKAATASPAPVAKDGASVAFELHEARTVREARNTRLARGPVVKPWMRRVRHERQGWGRCENAGRRISLPGHYVVARGDTLWQIALRHYRSGLYFMRIYRANRDVIRSPNAIYACERLYLPRR